MEIDTRVLDRLVTAASEVRANAYAPYSGYTVGAALLTDHGEVFTGVNVENASLGLSICAERHAVGAAIAAGRRRFVAMAVVTVSTPPAAPCGACRQVLVEFGDFPVVLANTAGQRRVVAVSELLPLAFTAGTLGLGDGRKEG